ncbi:MAG: efflux RND transporter periplasmic adaptor subunit [Planctomycetaceae bacterium]|jgi:RND family efflux transporter MFP subunit|nr:efflux RND transporter periplasmic adaptor subunit [Planctomycetaceae bacterium]
MKNISCFDQCVRIVPLILVIAVCGNVLLFAQIPGMSGKMPPAAVRVEKVTSRDSSQPRPYNGSITAKESVNLVPRVTGYLTDVKFQEGATVKKGDPLFEIEDTIYQINVRTAESQIRQTEAEIELAKKNLERANELYKRDAKAITDQERDEVNRTIQLLEARLSGNKASLDQANTDLSYTKIFAPLSGQIGAKQFSTGNFLSPNSGILATIVQYDPITIMFPVSEREYITYFIEGENSKKTPKIEIFLANNELFKGKFKIDFIDNKIDSHTGTLMIYLLCENPNKELVPGGWTKVYLSEHYANPKPAVNVAALMTDGKKHTVYVVNNEKKVEVREVEIGELVFDRQIIESGLKEGEIVIVGGLNKVKPGDEVNAVYDSVIKMPTSGNQQPPIVAPKPEEKEKENAKP